MLDKHAILQQHKQGEHADDSCSTGGAALVLAKPFVGDVVEHENAAEGRVDHAVFSSWKISSVEHAKMRANVSASSRLGT